ncbi:MAG TPA: polyamine aminopropyltransferase [Calditrichia bacterium]|nr:polyamine aminopropyltransferase [Calditrichota bacterium]HQV31556.1 polyamine aminopropyltransferase [Calditrichia bacterium]
MSITYTERYGEVGASLSFDITEVLFSKRSPFQRVEVVQTAHFGKLLVIDGFVMLTERDEFVYHEMMSHVPLFVHPEPKRVLVIGGGDGGTVRECLRHSRIEHIDLVDIDELVSEACLEHIPAVAEGLKSPRVTCRYEDGVAFVEECREQYDIILVDSTDPISVGEGLFTESFYRNCFNLLGEKGILVAQSESPAWQSSVVKRINQKLKKIFPLVHFYQAFIPTYPSGFWTFCMASKGPHPLNDFREARYRKANLSFRYYNEELHRGAFALPTYVKELLNEI